LAALVLKFMDFLRYLKAGDVNGIVSQLIVWISGVGALLLVAQTQWAGEIAVGDTTLSRLSFWSIVFAGMSIASVASAGKDFFKAVDSSNTAKIPTLLSAGPPARRVPGEPDVG
jgi:hypothetical protein